MDSNNNNQLSIEQKIEIYESLEAKFKKFLQKYDQQKYKLSFEARMASLSSLIKAAFKNDLMFCGFYVVTTLKDQNDALLNQEVLEIGPYVSDILATPRIDFGKGQCGQCWQDKSILVEADVSLCKNYIACDEETKSEIVIPVYRSQADADVQKVAAVWDIDSINKNRFQEIDVKYLQQLSKYTYL